MLGSNKNEAIETPLLNTSCDRSPVRYENDKFQNSLDYSMQSIKPPLKESKPDNRVLAVIAMNGFALCSCGMSIFFKGIQAEGVNVVEFTLFRNLFNFSGSLLLCCICNVKPCKQFPKEYRWTMFARATLGQACFACFVMVLAMIPLYLAMILLQTSPFWAGILGYFINKEPIEKFEYVAMILCFTGVLIITFGKSEDPNASADDDSATRTFGIAFAFFIAWLFAACNVINRYLKGLHYAMVIFYHALCGLTLAASYILIEHFVTGNPFRTYTADQYKTILLCCFFDFCAVNCQTLAFQNDTSGFVSLIGYMGVIYAFMADVFIFDVTISPVEIVGALLILAITVGVSVTKIRDAQKKKAAEVLDKSAIDRSANAM